MAWEPGTQIGRYEIVDFLGKGAMAQVFRARDTTLRREVAIKVLPESFSDDPEYMRRFQREARTVGMLNHPNIVAVYDIGKYQGLPYIITELLHGETLRQRIEKGPLPPQEAVDYARQMAAGLAVAHEKGITHRDLKPENIFITRDGVAKILDFGLAKVVKPGDDMLSVLSLATQTGMIVGTVPYMSPEQAHARPIDQRSDLFSFGSILYEMLSAEHAFYADTAAATISKIVRSEPPPLAVAPGLEQIVRRCIEKDPVRRFQTARDLGSALQSLTLIESASAVAPTAPVAAPAPRSWAWLAIAGVVMLAAIMFVAGHFLWPVPVAGSAVFHQLTFRRGTVMSARFAPEGQTIVYSARWDGGPPEVFSARAENPEPRPADAASKELLQESRVIVKPGAKEHLEFLGKPVYESAGWIESPRVSPDGKMVAFIDHPARGDRQGSVIVVDVSGPPQVLTSGWTEASGAAWSPKGDEVWFSAARAGSAAAIYAVKLDGRVRPVLSSAGQLELLDVARDGRLLVAGNQVRNALYAVVNGKDTADLSWGDHSSGPLLTPNGQQIVFTEAGVICVRGTDGSAVMPLGEGVALALSPDGQSVLAAQGKAPGRLVLLSLSGGQPVPLERGNIETYTGGAFLPDGKRVLFTGNEAWKPQRAYVQDLSGGAPQPVLREGYVPVFPAISPDSRTVVCQPGPMLCPLDGGDLQGDPRPLVGAALGERAVRWDSAGKFLAIYNPGQLPLRVNKLDLVSGQVQLWKEAAAPDRAGLSGPLDVSITADGQSLAYVVRRVLSELYVVDGVR